MAPPPVPLMAPAQAGMTWSEEESLWSILAAYASWHTRQGRVPDLGAMLAGLGLDWW
jgi:hypothetical protein